VWRYFLPLLPFALHAATLQLEIRSSEIWLIDDGRPRSLTHDGKTKTDAILSPAQERVAYLEQCATNCHPSIVIIDLDGHRIARLQPKLTGVPPIAPCASFNSIAWIGEGAIASECHLNPSLSEYLETDISTGRTSRDLLGYDFNRSPNGKMVAHVGWIIHFAPPYAQSNYLQIESKTIYPLPKGTRPVEQIAPTMPPEVVRKIGRTYYGIHGFQPEISWSPDSHYIALLDCTYNWTPNRPESLSAGDGKESGRQCAVRVISTTGRVALTVPLRQASYEYLNQVQVSWLKPREISLDTPHSRRTVKVP
jgi:hypothetical protein